MGSTGFGGIGTPSWQASIDRQVRRFRRVSDLGRYWELRPKFWEPEPRPAEPEPSLTAAVAPVPDSAPVPAMDSAGEADHKPLAVAEPASEGTVDHTDVLVIAALPQELEAAREAGLASGPDGPGVAQWEQRDLGDLPYWWGEYRIGGKTRFTVALARPSYMGGRVTGTFAARGSPTG